MRIALKAEVEGNILVPSPVIVKKMPFEFELFSKDGKFWLKVSKPVTEYEAFLPKVFSKNGVINIHIAKDDIFNDLKEWLQYIEAMGSFNFGIEHIYWDRATYCWIAESEAEHFKTPLAEYTRTPSEGGSKKRITNSNLANVVIYRKQLKDIHIPFTYYKEGQKFFHDCNYYFAFINYFMMLEYCFAEGKFRTNEVVKKFQESKILRLSILQFLSMPQMHSGESIWEWLNKECHHYNKALDVKGVVFLLVSLRGELFHASKKSEKRYRDDNELRPLVVTISTICFLVCGHLQIFGFTSEKQKEIELDKRLSQFEYA